MTFRLTFMSSIVGYSVKENVSIKYKEILINLLLLMKTRVFFSVTVNKYDEAILRRIFFGRLRFCGCASELSEHRKA